MKYWEAMKGLHENSNKTYEADIDGFRAILYRDGNYYRFEVYDDGVLIPPNVASGGFNDNIHKDLDWHEVKQPVTWREAFEAWLNGKPVTCKHSVSVYEYHDNMSPDRFAIMEDQDGNPPSKLEMLEGKWYIED